MENWSSAPNLPIKVWKIQYFLKKTSIYLVWHIDSIDLVSEDMIRFGLVDLVLLTRFSIFRLVNLFKYILAVRICAFDFVWWINFFRLDSLYFTAFFFGRCAFAKLVNYIWMGMSDFIGNHKQLNFVQIWILFHYFLFYLFYLAFCELSQEVDTSTHCWLLISLQDIC